MNQRHLPRAATGRSYRRSRRIYGSDGKSKATALQLHRVVQDTADLDDRALGYPVDNQMPRSRDLQALPAVPQMVAADTMAELRPGSGPEPERLGAKVAQCIREQLLVARLCLIAKTLRRPCKHVHDVRLRQGG
jgi:hypothetical protein